MTENITLAVVPYVYECSVLRIELAYSVVSCYAAVLTESANYAVLEFRFSLNKSTPPLNPVNTIIHQVFYVITNPAATFVEHLCMA